MTTTSQPPLLPEVENSRDEHGRQNEDADETQDQTATEGTLVHCFWIVTEEGILRRVLSSTPRPTPVMVKIL